MQVYGFGFCAILLALWSYGAGRIIMERHWPYSHSRRILQDSFIWLSWIVYAAVCVILGQYDLWWSIPSLDLVMFPAIAIALVHSVLFWAELIAASGLPAKYRPVSEAVILYAIMAIFSFVMILTYIWRPFSSGAPLRSVWDFFCVIWLFAFPWVALLANRQIWYLLGYRLCRLDDSSVEREIRGLVSSKCFQDSGMWETPANRKLQSDGFRSRLVARLVFHRDERWGIHLTDSMVDQISPASISAAIAVRLDGAQQGYERWKDLGGSGTRGRSEFISALTEFDSYMNGVTPESVQMRYKGFPELQPFL
jgi:hypothetical protein